MLFDNDPFQPTEPLSDPFAEEEYTPRVQKFVPRSNISVPHAPDCTCADCLWCEMMEQEEADRARGACYAEFMKNERAAAEARWAAMSPDNFAQIYSWNAYAEAHTAHTALNAR